MSIEFTREQVLQALSDKGALTSYTTGDILNKIAEARGKGIAVSFSGENLSGIDLSQETIQQLLKKGDYSESNPPLWYSGDLKREKIIRRPDIIASARDLNASEVKSKRAVDLEGVNFSNADLICANFEGADLAKANFEGARLHYANLKRTRLWDADFSRARLNSADLTEAAMQNAVFFWASLRNTLIDNCLLYHVRFDNTELSRYQVREIKEEVTAKEMRKMKVDARRHYADAAVAYNLLKNNFRDMGKPDDASWAFIKEKRMKRNTYRGFGWKWLSSWFLDITCQYGERPWRVFFLTLGTVLVFGILHLAFGSIASKLVEDNMLFSLGSFVTITFPGLEATNLFARFLTCVEAAIGISLFALLMYSLGRRMSGY